MKYDPLIYGKNEMERIVSIEVQDNEAILFIQQSDRSITTEIVDNKFWVLSDRAHGSDWMRLKGDLMYKWGMQYESEEEWRSSVRSLYKKNSYVVWNPTEALMVKDGYTMFKGLKHDEVSILSFDIETTSLAHDETAKILLIANTFKNGNELERRLFSYSDYETEGELLLAWCDWVREKDPTVITGHNIFMYDLPYMQYIAERNGVELNLGRNGSPIKFNEKESKFRKDGSQSYSYHKCHIWGRQIIDTMFLSIRYDVGRKYESYGLKQIIKQEGLEVEGRQFYDAAKIRDNYEDPIEWEKIKAYATFDGDDALTLYSLMIAPFFYMTQSVPKPFEMMLQSATGSQLNGILVRSYLQNGHSIPHATDNSGYVEGGISFAVPGVYRNVLKVDLKSAYPSQILRFKLYDKYKDPEGNFYKMVEYFTLKRFEYKKLYKETNDDYYLNMDQTSKIGINSAYGLCNTPGLNFNSPKIASKITFETRQVLENAIKWASGKDLTHWKQLFEEKTK